MGEGAGPAVTVGAGAAGAVLSAVLISPAIARPFVSVLGRVIGAPFGMIGRLARTNAVRNPLVIAFSYERIPFVLQRQLADRFPRIVLRARLRRMTHRLERAKRRYSI